MNTTDEIMALAEDYADWAADKSKAHPSTSEARATLQTAIDDLLADNASLREQNTALDGAVAELDRANLLFARRELWWNKKMFELEEKLKWAHHTPKLLSEADAAADLAGVARPGAEPVAAQQRFRHPQKTMPDWSPWQLCKPATRPAWEIDSEGYEVEYRAIYTTPQASQPKPALAAQPGAVGEIPTVCDGKEQEAFEKWAAHNRFNLSEHPLHYLFLDPKTDAARQAWKGALEYVGRVLAAAPTEAKPPQASQPLTDEQWNRVSRAALEAFFECSRGSVTSQIDCAAHAAMRATEKAHGIGAAQKGKP